MGMYTELVCALELKQDTPDLVINTLKYMVGTLGELEETPTHELFETDRWDFMLRGDSYYFEGVTNSNLYKDTLIPQRPTYYLTIRCNFKNYDGEIEKFIDWITPYSHSTGFIGYKRFEGDKDPALIYI